MSWLISNRTFTIDADGKVDLSKPADASSSSSSSSSPSSRGDRAVPSLISDLSPVQSYDAFQLDWVIYMRSKPWEAERDREYGLDVVACPSDQSSRTRFADHFEGIPYGEHFTNAYRDDNDDEEEGERGSPRFWSSSISAYQNSFTAKLDCFSVFSHLSAIVPVLEHAAAKYQRNRPPLIGQSFSADLSKSEAEVTRQGKLYKRNSKHAYRLDKQNLIQGRAFRAILIDRAETLFWDGNYGQKLFWQARRHQVFSPIVVAESERFRWKLCSSAP